MDNGVPTELGWQSRTRALLGAEAVERLARARVYVIGAGAVGSYAIEGLARAGVGMIRVVDFDAVRESNLNRQLLALHSTLGRNKAELAAERVLDINPAARVEAEVAFAHADTLPRLLSGEPDLVVDAVDSLNPKVEIIAAAAGMGVPVFSSLGAATRMNASAVRFGPLFAAKGCPLGRLVRKRLRRRGVREGDLWCVFSEEPRNPDAVFEPEPDGDVDDFIRGRRRTILGSLSTMTGIFGLRLAHEAVLRLSGAEGHSAIP